MKKTFIVSIALAAMFMLLIAGQATADKAHTPETLAGATVVDSDWVKANLGKIAVFDTRKKAEYVEKHISGAVSVYYDEKSEKKVDFDEKVDNVDLSKYPADKNTPVIVYCNGPECWKSYKSAVKLIKTGYKKVYWFREGFPQWVSKGYPTE